MKHLNRISYFVLAAALLLMTFTGCSSKETVMENHTENNEIQVENVVTGTGVLEAENEFEVNASVMGDIIAAPFEEGQQIHAGDLLYRIDQTDILNNIEKTRLGIEKAQLAYNQTADSINKLSIRSSISGTITSLNVNTGDMVNAGSKIADVVNNEVMLLKVPFIDEHAKDIYPGQNATVTIVGTFYTVNGTVKKVTSGSVVSSSGSVVKVVEINVPNPGTLTKGDKGTAIVGNTACSDAGQFDFSESQAVYAEVSGKVKQLNVSVGDKVAKNSVIVSLQNDSLITSQQQNAISIKEANLTLQNLNDTLKDYNITSSIDGIAIKKNLDKGDKISTANMAKMAVIADLSKIIFKINVDEMDVSKVAVGQSVSFTTDAIPDKEFEGTVEFVSTSGTQVSGVSLYEVKIKVVNPEGLMPGMSANAKIKLDGSNI